MIYLDNQTVRPPYPEAVNAMQPFLKELWGSPYAPHKQGELSFAEIEKLTQKLKTLLGARPNDKLIITSSGADAVAQLFQLHYIDFIRQTGRSHLISSEIEDAPIKLNVKRLTQNLGCTSKLLPVNSMLQIDPDELLQAIKPRTSLVSLASAGLLTGTFQPTAEIVSICKEKQVRVHFDVTSVMGKVEINFAQLGADYLTFDGTSFGAGSGFGALLIKGEHAHSEPVLGKGSFNGAMLAAAVAAYEKSLKELQEMGMEVARKRAWFEEELTSHIPGCRAHFTQCERLPNTSILSFPHCHADALLFLLSRKGVAASIGGGMSQKLNHLLRYAGEGDTVVNSSIGFQLSTATTESELDQAVFLIEEAVSTLRNLSAGIVGGLL